MTYLYRHIPNALTVLRICSAPFLWYAIVTGAVVPALFLISFAVATDFGDGYIARRFRFSSRAGTFLDPLADKVVVIAAFVALWQQQMMPLWVVLVVVWRDIAVTLLRMFLIKHGAILKTSWFAKSKTAFQLGALYIFVSGLGSHHRFFYGLSVAVAAVTVASALNYGAALVRFVRRRL